MTVEKGRIVSVQKCKAIVEIEERGDKKKRKVGFRPGIKLRAGDKVIIAFGMIVDKTK